MPKRINVVISEEANKVIKKYQLKHNFNTKDEAMDELLKEFEKKKR